MGMERFGNAVLALALLLPGASPAFEDERKYALYAEGDIVLNPDGTVRDYTLTSTELPPSIAVPVDRSVRSWRFVPVLVDGQPVAAKSRWNLRLSLEPVDGNYRMRITKVTFGNPKRVHGLTPPKYPRDAAVAGIGAQVDLALKLDDKGKVIAAHSYQTSLTHRANDKVSGAWRRRFEQAATEAAMQWTFDLTETIGGKTVESITRVPVEFVAPTRNGEGMTRWQSYVPGPINPLPWPEATGAVVDIDQREPGDDAPRSMSSRFRLVDDVVGKVL
ncbi:hypothetical protein HIV01_012665 [Lysobacter arenosi]|uniref:Energy transducer TonB n=1 Tax=Lysobacter arenosi TaxID=2795387 RepID=A0ABX7R9Q5_9GAMM|nr:hypothetical protein [Lysobacter arenosi]QSX74061.1 hypothetical protein HIV01_012665 [Lysobacter arenosi]